MRFDRTSTRSQCWRICAKPETVRPDDIEYAVEYAFRIVEVFETAVSLTPSDYGPVGIEFSVVEEFYKAL